jgi:hypothetical protein
MPKPPEFDHGQELPKLQGHAIGVVDSDLACSRLSSALAASGFNASKQLVFQGEDGIHLVNRMMEGSTWGESSEHFLMQCLIELNQGHSVVSVEVEDENEAAAVAAIASQFGAHSVYHFGLLTDTQLTK